MFERIRCHRQRGLRGTAVPKDRECCKAGTTLSACHERAGACKRGTPVRFLACIGVKERAPA
jgi:hypothetical protein